VSEKPSKLETFFACVGVFYLVHFMLTGNLLLEIGR
jgi:hypothetical protein